MKKEALDNRSKRSATKVRGDPIIHSNLVLCMRVHTHVLRAIFLLSRAAQGRCLGRPASSKHYSTTASVEQAENKQLH